MCSVTKWRENEKSKLNDALTNSEGEITSLATNARKTKLEIRRTHCMMEPLDFMTLCRHFRLSCPDNRIEGED